MSSIEMFDTPVDTPEAVVQSAKAMLARYLDQFPAERAGLAAMRAQLEEDGVSTLVRSTMRGHLTTSLFVYDEEADEILLIHHVIYDQWLPPGGHYEFPGSLWASAEREGLEETAILAVLHAWCAAKGIPLDIDTHPIPANPAKNEGDHFHHDITFLAKASSKAWVQAQLEEVHDAKWVPRKYFPKYCTTPRTVRMWHKFEALRSTRFAV